MKQFLPYSSAVRDESKNGHMPSIKPYPPGALLLQQGDGPADVFIIDRGVIKLRRVQPGGKESIIGIRTAGEFVGAAAAILGCPNPADAITVTPCRVARMDTREFVERSRDDRNFAWRLLEMQSRELCGDCDQLAELGCEAAEVRLCRTLQKLADEFGSTSASGVRSLTLPLKQWEVAQIVGVTPQYLCQLLADLERKGVLNRRGATFVLHAEPRMTKTRTDEVRMYG